MPVFRVADPDDVRAVWDAVRHISHQRQATDVNRLGKYLIRTLNCTQEEAECKVIACHTDGLLVHVSGSGRGKKRVGDEVSYKIPTDVPPTHSGSSATSTPPPGHDWYCHECHGAGEVVPCRGCHRVFHATCAKSLGTDGSVVDVVSLHSVSGAGKIHEKQKRDKQDHHHDNDELANNSIDDKSVIVEKESNGLDCKNEETDAVSKSEDDNLDDEKPKNSDTEVCNGVQENSSTLDTPPDSISKCSPNKSPQIPTTPKENSTPITNDSDDKTTDFIMEEEEPIDLDKSVDLIDDDEDCMIVSSDLGYNNRKLHGVSTKPDEDELDPSSYCRPCRLLNQERVTGGLVQCSSNELNYLLHFTYERIRTWLPEESLVSKIPSDKEQVSSADESWCSVYLIHGRPLTLKSIKRKLDAAAYKNMAEFLTDILDVVHHVGVLFGASSEEMDAVKYLLSDCQYDLNEIRQCRDCYRHSNEKSDPAWFAKPCMPRHELVYAKQRGYSYWPAKVIKTTREGLFDVRFFGAKHLRALIDPQNVRSIDTSFQDMQLMKRTASFNKAFEELQHHRRMLLTAPGLYSYNNERSRKTDTRESTESIDNDIEAPDISQASTPKSTKTASSSKNKDKSGKKRTTSEKEKKKEAQQKLKLNARGSPRVRLNRTIDLGALASQYAANNDNKEEPKSENTANTKPKIRMTRNSLVTAPTSDIMNVYDIDRISDDENLPGGSSNNKIMSNLTPISSAGRKRPLKRVLNGSKKKSKKSSDDSSKTTKSVAQHNTRGSGVTGAGKRLNSPMVDVVELDMSSGDEGSITTLKTINFNSDSDMPHSSQEALISSTQEIASTGGAPRLPRVRGGGVSRRENLERIRLQIAAAPDVASAAQLAHEALLVENERWESELQTMVDDQVKSVLSEVKKRQWCYYCGDEAIYYCCWNTAYCSTTCQQQHWQSEHKRVCRRKR